MAFRRNIYLLRRWPRWRTAAPPEPLWRCRLPCGLPLPPVRPYLAASRVASRGRTAALAPPPQLPLAGSQQPHGTKRRPVEPASRSRTGTPEYWREAGAKKGESRRPRDGGGCEVRGGREIGEAEGRQRECDAAEAALAALRRRRSAAACEKERGLGRGGERDGEREEGVTRKSSRWIKMLPLGGRDVNCILLSVGTLT
uniref:Uncharacterized protein n=1 Tax=Oryza meridionalis TaxID=40149 RepID=A0A0E0C0E0_9ORYZ